MRNVKILQAWSVYRAGDWAAVDDRIAENLIAKGIAQDPRVPAPEPDPIVGKPKARVAKPKAAKKKAKTKRKG